MKKKNSWGLGFVVLVLYVLLCASAFAGGRPVFGTCGKPAGSNYSSSGCSGGGCSGTVVYDSFRNRGMSFAEGRAASSLQSRIAAEKRVTGFSYTEQQFVARYGFRP